MTRVDGFGVNSQVLPQRHDCKQRDDTNGNNTGFERAKTHIAESDAFILSLDDGKQCDCGADDAEGADHV